MSREDKVRVGYSSASNITFRGSDTLPCTYEEWDEMTGPQQDQVLAEFLFGLVDVYVEDE
jgi:hypothetical protein